MKIKKSNWLYKIHAWSNHESPKDFCDLMGGLLKSFIVLFMYWIVLPVGVLIAIFTLGIMIGSIFRISIHEMNITEFIKFVSIGLIFMAVSVSIFLTMNNVIFPFLKKISHLVKNKFCPSLEIEE